MKKHLLQAAERGDAEAQFNLGIIYDNGMSDSKYTVEGSRSEAIRWLLAAAEQGLARAQIKLADLYAQDPGIPESSIQASCWYLLAMATLRGAQREKAQSDYVRASQRLNASELEKVRIFTEAWKPKT